MKHVFSLLIAGCMALSVSAQESPVDSPRVRRVIRYGSMSEVSPWCLDLNFYLGSLQENLTFGSLFSAYPSALNSSIGYQNVSVGTTYGGSLQLGYFFGAQRHWGVGAGLMLVGQSATVTVDNFHVEYKSLDYNHDTFRQVISSSSPIKERVTATNFSIPLMLKYQTMLSKKVGLMVDGGLLINIGITNKYTTNASFDYEAIYKFSQGEPTKPIYDYASVPSVTDWKITQAEFNKDNPSGSAPKYFDSLRAQGYNVGLGVGPKIGSGNVSYLTGSVGFLLAPSLSYMINDRVSLKGGVYYMRQEFHQNVSPTYMMTDKVGTYNSVINGVSSSVNSSFGVSIGLRLFFGKLKDTDHDGVPDRRDRCPLIPGLAKYRGCPDSDGDGIPDPDDSCPGLPGPIYFHGCPDSDNDSIPDNVDACPYQKGPAKYHGCPDTDGDGIPDNEDRCPEKAGPAKFHGCPDSDGDGVPDDEDQCPDVPGLVSNMGCPIGKTRREHTNSIGLVTNVLFDEGKTTIRKSSYHVLNEAARTLRNNPDAFIYVDGYTDNVGGEQFNKKLSIQRAISVKKYLLHRKVRASQIRTAGHGEASPKTTNRTERGRAKNRRVKLMIKYNKKHYKKHRRG